MKLFAVNLIIFFLTQNLFAQNTPPPEMPIPPEFSQPAPGAMPSEQHGNPGQPHHQEPMPQPQQLPQAQPQVIEPHAAPVLPAKARLPDDFELIEIKPYFKNKTRLGKLTATVTSVTNETLATVAADFGDCKNCIRGASLKGKLGIRLYGNNLKDLVVSRKQSSSIKLVNCNNKVAFVNTYTCEFSHKDAVMKLTLKLDL